MKGYFRITRPVNGTMGLLATFLSAFIGNAVFYKSYLIQVILAAVVVFLVTSGGNVLNDILDADTDKINHPGRPIASGSISPRNASYYFFLLFALPVAVAGLFLPFVSLLIVLVAEALLVTYELRTKGSGLAGNVSISILVGLIFIFGGTVVNSVLRMVLLFLMASLATVSRELIKDIEDIKGDVGRTTFPKRYGIDAAYYLSFACIVVAISISYLPYHLGIFSYAYLIPVAVADAVFVFSAAVARSKPTVGQRLSKIAMIIGLVAFASGAFIP